LDAAVEFQLYLGQDDTPAVRPERIDCALDGRR
jgi:hypothetical protein